VVKCVTLYQRSNIIISELQHLSCVAKTVVKLITDCKTCDSKHSGAIIDELDNLFSCSKVTYMYYVLCIEMDT